MYKKMNKTRLFLASSSELEADRQAFEIFINRRNKDLVDHDCFLELVVWEDFFDAISPTRLQDEYNRASRECEIFVMLFSTKVGRHTAEEFEHAFGSFKATGKPLIFTYFKDVRISVGSADQEDLMSLWAFRKRLKALGHYETGYENSDRLASHFSRQLETIFAREDKARAEPAAGRAMPAGISAQLDGYLRWLRERCECIELRGIERAGGSPVVLLPLAAAYVPLRARATARPEDELAVPPAQRPSSARDQRSAAGLRGEGSAAHDGEVDLSQVLALGTRLVIIGGPGSGKTTVLLNIAWALASSLLSGAAEPARSRLGLALPAKELPLPIFVPLASFARYRRELASSAPAQARTLAHFISHHLISKQAGDFDLAADFFVQLLRHGREVILLLDGLDEVANEDQRAQVRQAVEELVGGRDTMRVVVTCRTVAYRSGRTALGAKFREISVRPLDLEQHVTPMVTQAYTCIHPEDVALRTDRVQDLLGGIRRLEDERRARLGGDAAVLVNSPLMVRLLLIVHVNNRRLPDGRAELFDKAINALLQVDYGRDQANVSELGGDWKRSRDMAQQLAVHMHRQGRDQGRDIDERGLRAALRADAEFAPYVEDFLAHARQRGSVLEERQGSYRFIHLALQEFLVARYLREVTGGESREAILAFLDERLDDPWWREPILLLAGYWASTSARSARDFLAALANAGGTAGKRFAAAELAASAALECHDGGEALRADCARRVVDLLRDGASLVAAPSPVRARAGDVLSRLGDPRFDGERHSLPADALLGFVRIAADPGFRIGTRRADAKRVAKNIVGKVPDAELNDALTPTAEFLIARYPVTVAQFRAFVEATGIALGDADALRDGDSRPVRWVSWHEAMAYCEWLNTALVDSPLLRDSEVAGLVRSGKWEVALPSELEWEKAARGGLVGAVYSWGDEPDAERANYADSQIGDTSVVGCFPGNGYGLHDLIGNVWEWTRSEYRAYPIFL